MQSARFLATYLQICRRISSSSVTLDSAREGRFIRKLIHGSKRAKRAWYDTSADMRSNMSVVNSTEKLPSIHTQRRIAIRNKLFMEHITDLMSTGEVANILDGIIEITHVQITADFKYVNVFWIQSSNVKPVSAEALQKCAWAIRHKLSQLRIIGIVPPIQFVKNKQFLIQQEVENKLARIKLEQDSFEPLSHSEQMESAASDTVERVLCKESFVNRDFILTRPPTELPPMRHDVLGLDRHKMMSQISASVSKSQAAVQRQRLDTDIDRNNTLSCDTISNEATEFLTQQEQKEVFLDFLKKRRLEEKRRYRAMHVPEQELLNNLQKEKNSNYEQNYDNEEYSDEYIDEYSNEDIDEYSDEDIDEYSDEDIDKYSDELEDKAK